MKRLFSAGLATIAATTLMAFSAGPASAATCHGKMDIVDNGPLIVENATGNCRFMEGGSSAYPSVNGETLFNVVTIPVGPGKWIQVHLRDSLGLSALFADGKGTNTWYG